MTPHGLVQLQRARAKQSGPKPEEKRAAFHAARRERIVAVRAAGASGSVQGDDREQVIAFLKARGLDEKHLVEGSVPPQSLGYILEQAIAPLDPARPVTALHIGNFVGVSLAFLATVLRRRHPDALVVSVDPNLTHRGISNPQAHVSALLTACGVQRNVMIIAGYSGRKSISNDGVVFDGYDPEKEFSKECACEESIRNLSALCPQTFDLIMMDGNHEASYLLEEIQTVLPLLKVGGVVILDDVDAAWAEIRGVFAQISNFGMKPIGTDGRVGVALFMGKPSPKPHERSASH